MKCGYKASSWAMITGIGIRQILKRVCQKGRLRANAGSAQKISCFWNHGGPQIFMKMSLFDGPNEKIRIPKPFLPKCTRSRKNGGQRIWWLLLLIFGPKTEMMIVGSFLTQFFWNLVSKLDSMISLRFQRKKFLSGHRCRPTFFAAWYTRPHIRPCPGSGT